MFSLLSPFIKIVMMSASLWSSSLGILPEHVQQSCFLGFGLDPCLLPRQAPHHHICYRYQAFLTQLAAGQVSPGPQHMTTIHFESFSWRQLLAIRLCPRTLKFSYLFLFFQYTLNRDQLMAYPLSAWVVSSLPSWILNFALHYWRAYCSCQQHKST